MSLIDEVLIFTEHKEKYSLKERERIKKELVKKCNIKLKKLSQTFLKAFDDINEL